MTLPAFAFTRRALIVLGIGTIMTACASLTPPATVADAIAADPSLSTLNGLLAGTAIGETLKTTGPFTVFAPSNDAFKALSPAVLDNLKQHPDKLNSVLSFHVLPGKTLTADVKTGKAMSLQGAALEVSRAGTFVTVENAVVTVPDQVAGNGVVHVIDTVLIPPVKK